MNKGCLNSTSDGPNSDSSARRGDGLSFFEQRDWPAVSFSSPCLLSGAKDSEKALEEAVLDGNETLHKAHHHTAELSVSDHGVLDPDRSTPAGYKPISTLQERASGIEHSPSGSYHVAVGYAEHSIPLHGTADTKHTAAASTPVSIPLDTASGVEHASAGSVEPTVTPVGASDTENAFASSTVHSVTQCDQSAIGQAFGSFILAASAATDHVSGSDYSPAGYATHTRPADDTPATERASGTFLASSTDHASASEHARNGSAGQIAHTCEASGFDHAPVVCLEHVATSASDDNNDSCRGQAPAASVADSYACLAGVASGTEHASGTFLASAGGKNGTILPIDVFGGEHSPAGSAGLSQPSSDITSLPECATSNPTATGLHAQCPADTATEIKSNLSDQRDQGPSTVDQCTATASTDTAAVNSDVCARTTAASECISPVGVFSPACNEACTTDTVSAYKQSCAATCADSCDNQSEGELSAAVEPREGSDSDSDWLVLDVNDREQIQDCTGMS